MAKTKAVAKRATSKNVVNINDSELAVYSTGEADGFEESDSDSYAIPRLKLLQKLSPEVDEDNGEYIEGAKHGQFFNTATGELFPDGVKVIPCHYRRSFIEWVPRPRSEERRVGKECRSRWSPYY